MQDRISNEELYKRCQMEKWSKIIKRRRLSWYAHLMRLPQEAPARKALEEERRKVKKPKGGQKVTWKRLTEKDLKDLGIAEGEEEELAQNREKWRSLIHHGMLDSSDGNRN